MKQPKFFLLVALITNLVANLSAYSIDVGPVHADIDPDRTLEQAKQEVGKLAHAALEKAQDAAGVALEEAKKAGERAAVEVLKSLASVTIDNPDFLISNAIIILNESRGVSTPSVFIEICRKVKDALALQKTKEGAIIKSVMNKYLVLLPLLAQTRSSLSLQNPQSVGEMRRKFKALIKQTKVDVKKKLKEDIKSAKTKESKAQTKKVKKYYGWIFEGADF